MLRYCVVVGCSEMLMANAVQLLAAKTPGKESMAMEAFARALRKVRELMGVAVYLHLSLVANNNC